MKSIRVSGNRFVDREGRHVILHGINLVYKGEHKNGTMNYIGPWTEDDIKKFSDWGFNVIRLGLIWDAVEPEPGVYNQRYLDWIERMLDLCSKYNIHAYLDMHQDLYSVRYSDGAPQWATLTDDLPHVSVDLWSDAYLFSQAVHRAFDHFWNNTPASDGLGLLDHYAQMWAHIATRFGKHPAVIGYDFLNEPFPGSMGSMIFGALMQSFSAIMQQHTGKEHTLEEMIAIFSDPHQKFEALQLLESSAVYTSLAKSIEPLVAEFDLGPLDAFYRKVTHEVRTVDLDTIILRENSYFSNMGIECMAQPIMDAAGNVEPQQAFSPHGYDLVVDTPAVAYASNARVDVIFHAHRRVQERLGVPVLVGEWGAHAHYEEGLSHIEHLLAFFEQYLWSNTYWCYESALADYPVINVLKRPYPQAVCGDLLYYRYDRAKNELVMQWEENTCSAPTQIYLPTRDFSVQLIGEYQVLPGEENALLTIKPVGEKRSLRVTMS